ncbi:MTOR-associated protein MEAK7-like [Apostichopus japonicus]|uniref:MTOR-associated protein MEAK7-like n=1 Tax=Stichopus japonicus TaxID=307972 RepID=UPI003AB2CB96
MGASGSSANKGVQGGLKAEYDASLTLFNAGEQNELQESFEAICSTKAEEKTYEASYKGFTFTQLEKFIRDKIPTELSRRLFNQMWLHQGAFKQPEEAVVSKEAFIITLGKAMKGTVEEQGHIIVALSTDADTTKGIPRNGIRKLVDDLLTSYEKIIADEDQKRGWRVGATEEQNKRFINYIIKEIVEESSSEEPSILTESEVHSWLQHTAMFQLLFTHVFYLCFSQTKTEPLPETSDADVDFVLTTQPSLLPVAQDIPWTKASSLLDVPSLLLLNRHLPHQLRLQWRFLYSSLIHGASFATFLSHIKDKGPIILVVKDSNGNIFGSFVSESLELGPAFTGSPQSFLFQLSPALGIFESSGQNDNYVYLNIDQQTLPNGLGMGGQLYHFGFYLSQDFGKGHSKGTPRCTTFDSPQLSAEESFDLDVLEAWALGPPPKAEKPDSEDEDIGQKSILDKDPEAQAILELAGKERKSEGLREQDADIPEIHHLPPM